MSSLPATQPSQPSQPSQLSQSMNLSGSLLDTSSANSTTNTQFDKGLSTQDVSTQQITAPTPSNTPAPSKPRPQTPGPVKRTRIQDSLDLEDTKRKREEFGKRMDEADFKSIYDEARNEVLDNEDEYSGMSDETLLQATKQMRRNEACLSSSSTTSNLSTGSSVIEVDKDYKVPARYQDETMIENIELTLVDSPSRDAEEVEKMKKNLTMANKTIVDKNNKIMTL